MTITSDTFSIFQRALNLLRTEIGKKDMPVYWIEFFLLVAESGEKGITTQDAAKALDMTQGIASRMVKLMSRWYDPEKKTWEGFDVLTTAPDHIHRHRQRVFLSSNGKAIAAKLDEFLR